MANRQLLNTYAEYLRTYLPSSSEKATTEDHRRLGELCANRSIEKISGRKSDEQDEEELSLSSKKRVLFG